MGLQLHRALSKGTWWFGPVSQCGTTSCFDDTCGSSSTRTCTATTSYVAGTPPRMSYLIPEFRFVECKKNPSNACV